MTFQKTATTFRQGSFTLPGEYYTSLSLFAEELERIHARSWVCVGRADRLERPGTFFLREVAGESLILVKGRLGQPRAFFNVCRHRGTRLCDAESGSFSETIQCPYHAWTYTIDGRLIGAPHMQEVLGFDKRDYPLHQAALAEWEGFLFVNLDADPPPLTEALASLGERMHRFGLPSLKVGHRTAYEVRANWKLVFQNYSECLHCPLIHPELSGKVPYQSGENDLLEGPCLGGYMVIAEPNQSITLSGKRCGRLIADLNAEDRQRGYYYSIMPNLLLSVHPDYVNFYLIWPLAIDRTLVESEWLFHPDSFQDPGFSPQDAIGMWDLTNRQDWHITELSYAGIRSRRYAPGPYSARESLPAAWDRAYLTMMGRR